MSVPAEIMTLLFKETGYICNASKNLRGSTLLEKAQGGIQVVGGASVCVSGMLELLMIGGDVAQEATGIAGKALGAVPSAIKFWNQYLKEDLGTTLGLPKIDQSTFYKNLNQKQQPITQQLLFNFHTMLQGLGPSQAETLHKVILGDTSASRRPPGLLGLKQTGEALRDLPTDKRRAFVELFTQACNRYLENPSMKQSKSTFYLISALTEGTKAGKLNEWKQKYLSEHKISPQTQMLLEASNFPNNLRHEYLWNKEFLSICDPIKLRLEVQRVKNELIQKNGNGSLFTDAELEQVKKEMESFTKTGQDPAAYSLYEKQKLDELTKRKIFSKINLPSVISDRAFKHARFLQEMERNASSPDPDANTDIKFYKILEFLNTCNPKSKLAKEIDSILIDPRMQGSALDQALHECYQKSLQCVYDGLDTPTQMVEREDVGELPEVPGLSSLSSEPDRTLKRDDALQFYKDHLNHPDKMSSLMSEFNKELDNFNNPSPQPTQSVSMAKIAILLGKLDPQKDKKEVEAYKDLLMNMRASLQRKINEIPENTALCGAFEFAQRVLDEITIASFVSRGLRLEQKDKDKGYVSTATSLLSKAASAVGLLAPPTVVVTAPVAAAFGSLSALVNVIKYTPDSAGMRELSVLLSSKEHSANCYEDAMEKLTVTLSVMKSHHSKMKSMLATAGKDPNPLTDDPNAKRCVETILESVEKSIDYLETARRVLKEEIGEFSVGDSKPEQILEQAISYETRIMKLLEHVAHRCDNISMRITSEMQTLNEIIKPREDDSQVLMHL